MGGGEEGGGRGKEPCYYTFKQKTLLNRSVFTMITELIVCAFCVHPTPQICQEFRRAPAKAPTPGKFYAIHLMPVDSNSYTGREILDTLDKNSSFERWKIE